MKHHAASLIPVAIALTLAASACDVQAPADRGKAVFESTSAGGAAPPDSHDSKAPYSCAFCHDVARPIPQGFLKPGYSMRNVTRRTSFWGGTRRTLRDAANLCVTSFMRAPEPGFLPDDPEWQALALYLDSLSDPMSIATTLPMSEPVDCSTCPTPGCDSCAPVGMGDPAAGAQVYRQTCAHCHASFGSATPTVEFAPALLKTASGRIYVNGTEPDDADNSRSHVSAKIRWGNFGLFGVPAADAKGIQLPPGTLAHISKTPNMPPYSHQLISEDDLINLLAYLFPGGV